MQRPIREHGTAAALAQLCDRAWSLRLLDLLRRHDGARFVELVAATNASRPRLQAALESLIEASLIMRNPGYGHPLRPEYILTQRGRRAASPASECLAVASRWRGHADIIHRKWPLPVLNSIGTEERRFSALQGALPGATARALSLTLTGLAEAGLVRREVVASAPPSALYTVAKAARPILAPAMRLAGALASATIGAAG